MESTGYFMHKWDEKEDEVSDDKSHKMIEEMEKADLQNKLPPKAVEVFSRADNILHTEFNFYSFAVKINAEQ